MRDGGGVEDKIREGEEQQYGRVVRDPECVCVNIDCKKVWLYVHRHVNRCAALRPLMNECFFFSFFFSFFVI
jgi:hypothetical protein